MTPTPLESRLEQFFEKSPQIDPSAYIAKEATVVGDVHIGAKASIWPNAVLRADINTIEIGEGSNIQDGSIIHLSNDCPTKVGRYVTVGHMAILHGCTVQDGCLIGMRATIMDNAEIGEGSIVAAGSLVLSGTIIPPGSMVMGSPAKVVRTLSGDEQEEIQGWAQKYIEVAKAYRKKF